MAGYVLFMAIDRSGAGIRKVQAKGGNGGGLEAGEGHGDGGRRRVLQKLILWEKGIVLGYFGSAIG